MEIMKKEKIIITARRRIRCSRVNTVERGRGEERVSCEVRERAGQREERGALVFLKVCRRAPRSEIVALRLHTVSSTGCVSECESQRAKWRDALIHIKNAVKLNAKGNTKKKMKNPADSNGIETVPNEYLARSKHNLHQLPSSPTHTRLRGEQKNSQNSKNEMHHSQQPSLQHDTP